MTPSNFGLPGLPGIPNLNKITARYAEQAELGSILSDALSTADIPSGERAVVYLRVSDPSQTKTSTTFAHGDSMETQRRLCYARAAELGSGETD